MLRVNLSMLSHGLGKGGLDAAAGPRPGLGAGGGGAGAASTTPRRRSEFGLLDEAVALQLALSTAATGASGASGHHIPDFDLPDLPPGFGDVGEAQRHQAALLSLSQIEWADSLLDADIRSDCSSESPSSASLDTLAATVSGDLITDRTIASFLDHLHLPHSTPDLPPHDDALHFASIAALTPVSPAHSTVGAAADDAAAAVSPAGCAGAASFGVGDARYRSASPAPAATRKRGGPARALSATSLASAASAEASDAGDDGGGEGEGDDDDDGDGDGADSDADALDNDEDDDEDEDGDSSSLRKSPRRPRKRVACGHGMSPPLTASEEDSPAPSPGPNGVHKVSHNEMERKRRGELRAEFQRLRVHLPKLASENAAKIVILNEANAYLDSLHGKLGAAKANLGRMQRERDLLRRQVEEIQFG
jgi:hypothetical protein